MAKNYIKIIKSVGNYLSIVKTLWRAKAHEKNK